MENRELETVYDIWTNSTVVVVRYIWLWIYKFTHIIRNFINIIFYWYK